MKKTATAAVIGALLALLAGSVDAQTRPAAGLVLARLCVNETGWEGFVTDECLAIHEVLLRGAARHSMTYTTYASLYAPRLMGRRTHDVQRLRWVSELQPNGEAPPSWPTQITRRRRDGSVRVVPHARWSTYRDRWLIVHARARQVVSTLNLENWPTWRVCEGEVHDWGGDVDAARATRLGLIEIECGDSLNHFYQRPSLAQARD